ncbi:hypothetical protein HY407_02605 [Candidatus Gottesmanbacteria bacterium]|nr:hypothetical protein [Candidatus Gottesmanbacteria bacterium]
MKLTIKDVAHFRRTFYSFVKEVLHGKYVEPVPMVNNGYLHTLNASFDGLFLREQQSDSLLVANRTMNFGTIQPCIRTEDKLAEKRSLLHLGLFNICGYSMLDFGEMSTDEMVERTIEEFFTFYTKYLHLDPRLLRIYIFGGGTLRKITGGVIRNDEYIKSDDFSVNLWKRFGIPENQLIREYSKETFLLHLGNPLREHHVGYRNDIFMQVGDGLYEVATLNFISHQTVIENNEIIGIKKLPFYLREMAVGQERILAAIIGAHNLYALPYIKPLLEAIRQKIKDKQKALIFTDALRVIHYFFSDGWTYERLRGKRYREHRHELNKFMEIIAMYGKSLEPNDLSSFLKLNANLQSWYPVLQKGMALTIREINQFNIKLKG